MQYTAQVRESRLRSAADPIAMTKIIGSEVDALLEGGRMEGGGGESEVPGAGAAVVAMVGVDNTVNPAGIRLDAEDASKSLIPRLACAASAAFLDADAIVISSRTDAAVTLSETKLFETPAAAAKFSTMACCTLAV